MQGGCPVATDSIDEEWQQKKLHPLAFKREQGTDKRLLSEDVKVW